MENVEKEIKEILVGKLKKINFRNNFMIEERVEQLLNIHRTWIAFAKFKQTPEEMAQVLFQYEMNLNK